MNRIDRGKTTEETLTFGQALAAKRRSKGLSQFQLGKLIGVTDKAISKWENGNSYPRIEHCIKLATLLDVSLDELLLIKDKSFGQ